MYKKSYLPARYVFYPLYRYFRRRARLPSTLAFFLVFLVSAILHALMMLAFGIPHGAIGFFILYLFLGIVGVVGIRAKKRKRGTGRSNKGKMVF